MIMRSMQYDDFVSFLDNLLVCNVSMVMLVSW